MKKNILKLQLLIFLLGTTFAFAQSVNTLWYQEPANFFEESLVLGNGKMGASIFGGVNSDKIYLNDATLWSGEPVNANMNPDGYKNIPSIRKALKEENYKRADSINKFKLQGNFSEAYMPLGTLNIDFDHSNKPHKNYHRELDLTKAISKTSYEINGVQFTREYFISNPDQLMIIKLTSSKKEAINCSINFESLLKYTITETDKHYQVDGYAPYHVEPVYRKGFDNPVLFDKDRGTRFTTLIDIKNTDGKVLQKDNSLVLSDATEAVILVSIATSFNGFDKDPAKKGKDNNAIALNALQCGLKKSYKKLKKSHLKDYQSFYDRVSLSLGETNAPKLPTNKRLKRYAKGEEDKNLEILYFNFGRYLLISSSRTEGVPANLQGIWNPHLQAPWSSNYTLNINTEENYWLAENANLSELHQPLLSFIKNISKTGAITAKTFYGVNGWSSSHNSDIWAMSNPAGAGKGKPKWANWNMSGTWLSTHYWEHYTFNQDIDYLRDFSYPVMKGAAQFCLEWLVEGPNGTLLTSPSTSPENEYLTPSGYKGATLYGSFADIAMITELFEQIIKVSEILDIDVDFRNKVSNSLAKLQPYKIGKKGNLQEWYHDWEDNDPQHRHQTHLYGLYPGQQISPAKTPELAEACRNVLEVKGDETTGWSKGWRINLWARLWDGNRAYKMYRELLNLVEPSAEKKGFKGGTYPNLFDAHPPFQIDGNFGGSAAVIEMLVQSNNNIIRLLPALPDAWIEGKIEGICARGGFEIAMKWENKKVLELTIVSKTDTEATLIHLGKEKQLNLKKGKPVTLKW